MIRDAQALSDIRADWDGVRRMRDRMKVLVVSTFASGSITASPLSGVVYNLPLLLAFDVFGDALAQLRREGRFACSQRQLGPLVDCARMSLPWLDWQVIRDGVHRRNEVAHDGNLHDSNTCKTLIDALEQQLIAWGIVQQL